MTIRLLSRAGGAVVVSGTATGAGATLGFAGAGHGVMSAASAGAMTPCRARETAASRNDRRSAMVNDLEELMLLIDTQCRGVAGLVADAVKDVVDTPGGRIDSDIDARLRRLAGDGRAVADRLAETSDRAVERAVPLHRNHAVELARDDRRLRCDGGARLDRSDPGHLARRLVHALLQGDLRVRHARRVDIRRDRGHAAARERQGHKSGAGPSRF